MYAERYVRRDFLKAGSALLISVLWGDEPASAKEKRVTDSTVKRHSFRFGLRRCRSVAPALEHSLGLWKRTALSPRGRSFAT